MKVASHFEEGANSLYSAMPQLLTNYAANLTTAFIEGFVTTNSP